MTRILTGLKSTAEQFHIANFFGAVAPMLNYQSQGLECYLMVADLHSMTKFESNVLKNHIKRSRDFIKIYLAAGVDPTKTTIFQQSHIPEHLSLSWILGCATHMGFMQRMHAYKDAINKGSADSTSIGTFTYPILMAADILLYDIDLVPVGKDQKQHVEYARDIAGKFNTNFGDMFVLPQAKITTFGEIPGIDGRKMSKSYDNYIGIMESPEEIYKKVKRILTDAIPVEAPKDPMTDVLYRILLPLMSDAEKMRIDNDYLGGGMSYKLLKDFLYEKIVGFVSPLQKVYADISDDYIDTLIINHTNKAQTIASHTMKRVQQKIFGA